MLHVHIDARHQPLLDDAVSCFISDHGKFIIEFCSSGFVLAVGNLTFDFFTPHHPQDFRAGFLPFEKLFDLSLASDYRADGCLALGLQLTLWERRHQKLADGSLRLPVLAKSLLEEDVLHQVVPSTLKSSLCGSLTFDPLADAEEPHYYEKRLYYATHVLCLLLLR